METENTAQPIPPLKVGSESVGADMANKRRNNLETPVDAPKVLVEIYVQEHCETCLYAHEVAQNIKDAFPQISVRLIDIFQSQNEIPEAVFATPTYLLNGQVWSLGNPAPEDISERLSRAINTQACHVSKLLSV